MEAQYIECPVCYGDWYCDLSKDELKRFTEELYNLLEKYGFPYDEGD